MQFYIKGSRCQNLKPTRVLSFPDMITSDRKMYLKCSKNIEPGLLVTTDVGGFEGCNKTRALAADFLQSTGYFRADLPAPAVDFVMGAYDEGELFR